MWLISNYFNDLKWVKEYTNDFVVYDQSGTSDLPNTIQRSHVGSDIMDKMSFIVENYNKLPDILVMVKGNLFKYISKEEFELVKDNKIFTPLLTKNHKTYMPVCFYSDDGMYNEINNSWYLNSFPPKYYKNYNDFAVDFGLPYGEYLKFAPGSNYIVPKENILTHEKEYYERLKNLLDYEAYPAEAQIIERSLYEIWR